MRINRAVKRIGEIDPPAVAADLDHLRTAVQGAVSGAGMGGARNDAADAHPAGLLRLERIRYVILDHVAGPPAGDVKKPVVHRQVDIGDQRRHGLEALQQRRKDIGIRRLGRNLGHLPYRPFVALPIPGPDRGGEILEADHTADEAIGLGRIMCRAQFENELMFLSEIDLLQVLALVQIPEMQPPPVFAAEQDFRNQALLEGVGRAPFAGDHGVMAEMPPEVIGQFLRTAVHFPLTHDLETLRIEQENAARRLAFPVAERVDVDAFRTAMDGVQPGISRLFGHLLRLDDLDNLRVTRIGLGVDDMQARRTQAGHDEIAALHMRMRRIRAEARRARVPAEVMQFVTGVGHIDPPDDLRIGRRRRIDVDDRDRVGLHAIGIEGCYIGELLGRRLGCHARRWIERRIRLPACHERPPGYAPASWLWPSVQSAGANVVHLCLRRPYPFRSGAATIGCLGEAPDLTDRSSPGSSRSLSPSHETSCHRVRHPLRPNRHCRHIIE